MKKAELKKILKPLVAECVKETILEDGLLTRIVSEVAGGMSKPITESAPMTPTEDTTVTRMKRNAFTEQQSAKMRQHKNKLMEAIGGEAYNGVDLFAGTTPAPAQASAEAQSTPLAGVESSDPGVDISNLMGSVGRNWNAHMNEMKEGK